MAVMSTSVRFAHPITWNGVPYRPGDVGSVADSDAVRLIAAGYAAPTSGEAPIGSDPLDVALARWVGEPQSKTRDALVSAVAAQAASSSAAQRVLSRMKRKVEDVTFLNMSDSTGFYAVAEPRWYRKLAEKMATDWPAYTFKFVPWDDTAQGWGAAVTLQTGTGAYTAWFYNAAVTGTKMDYFLGSRFTFITALQPDLVFTNYGLNDGQTDLPGAKGHGRERILMLTESVTAECPSASVIILSQNERTDVVNEVVAARANRYARAAEQRGYGFIDTRQAFADDPRGLAALLNADGLHPNNAGSDLQRDTIYRHMIYQPDLQPRPMLPSCFLTAGPSLLTNGDFASFAAPPVLPSWTANNATLSKDVTHFEGPNGYSVNLVAASAAASSMDQNFNLPQVKGHWVTAALRVWIPTGQTNTAGRIALQCGDGADVTSIGNLSGRDGWQWVIISKRISPTATFARVRVSGDTAASAGANISIDRVVAVLGQLPRDIR